MSQRRVERVELVDRIHDHRPQSFLDDFSAWHEVELPLSDFKKLLLNSWPFDTSEKAPNEIPTLQEAYERIKTDPDAFFALIHSYGGISGAQVKKYLDDFRQGMQLRDCFIVERHPNMNPNGSYYIRDGMHRLVAYALFSELNPKFFPIQVYLGSKPYAR